MLRFFAKLERSRSFLLLAFCALLLIGLIAFYIPNTTLGPGAGTVKSSADDTVIAKVGSQEITLKEYRGALSNMLSAFGRGNTLPLNIAKSIGYDKQALDQLISERLVIEQGRELNLTGTDREVGNLIIRTFTNEQGAFIGRDEYLRRIRLSGLDVEEYENGRRNDITARKVRDFVISPTQVSDREVEEKYKDDNTKVEVVYATVDREKIRSKFNPTEQDLRSYYDARKDEFKADEKTRKVEYIFIPTKEVAKTVPVTDEELKKEYESRKQYEKRASIIKLNVMATSDESTVKTKIDELARKVRDPKGASGEDFSAVAKGNSMDPSAKQGGDIGWIKKEPNKTSQWQQRVYTNDLEVGAVDGPFREGRSWYLLKVTEKREVPFDQMRETLKATAQNNKAYKVTNDLAQKAYEKATEYKDLRKAAEEIAKEVKVSADSLLKTTPYFKDGDEQKDLGDSDSHANNPAFDSATNSLAKGEIGEKVSIPGGFAVPRVVDILGKGSAMSFEQARNQVENKYRQEKEPTLAQARAQEILNQSKSVEDFERLVKAEGLESKSDTNFNNYSFPGGSQGGSQASNQARAALKSLKEGEVAKSPIKVGASYLIFAAKKRDEADLSKLPQERDGVRQSILSERQSLAFDAFVKAARKRYEDQGKIKIYQDRIDKFFKAAEAAEQQQQ
ncbi:MAG TPA: peptidyl-prolyl cis-trans isomerase [Blastocatellia bacterium]|jgi:peptidyl-prolyl cis-trans isomerase D|nr:peptidyl-prolyl cis-trans isomerase [Blastocatellia bacterium]